MRSKKIHTMNIRDASKNVINILQKGESISFFCGAGISNKPPSVAPLWKELRDGLILSLLRSLVFKKFLNHNKFKSIQKEMKVLQSTHNIWIKPEVALHWFHTRFGDYLFNSFNILNIGKPNNNHKIITGFVVTGFPVIIATTNFDLYFEKVFKEQRNKYRIYASSQKAINIGTFKEFSEIDINLNNRREYPILKIHGTLEEPKTIKATLQQVGREIEGDASDALFKVLNDRHVVVVGYSGNDFDLFPFIEKNARFAKSIIWVARSKKSIRNELYDFPKNCTLAIGNLNYFFQLLYQDLLNNAIFRFKIDYTSRKQNIEKKKIVPEKELDKWASKIDIMENSYSLALFGMHIGFYDLTMEMCELIINSGKSNDIYRARALNVLGNCYKRLDLRKAVEIINEAEIIGYRIRNNNPAIYGNILGNNASILHELGRNQEALKYLRKSNYWARKAKLYGLIAANYDDFGNIYRHLGQPKKAIEYHKKALAIRKENNDLIGLSLTLNNIGLAYAELKDYENAEKYLEESITLKQKETSDLPALKLGMMNFGEILLLSKKYDASIEKFQEALRLAELFGDKLVKARTFYGLAENYRCIGKQKKALYYFSRGEKLSKDISYWEDDKYRMGWINQIKQNFYFDGLIK